MKVQVTKEYGDGSELWFGVPSWDPSGRSGEMSVKFAYLTANKQRWARTSPEVPETVVWDMVVMLNEQDHLLAVLRGLKDRSDKFQGTLPHDLKAVIATLQKALRELE